MDHNKVTPPARGILPVDQIFGDDAEDTHLLLKMATDARSYIESFAWCKQINDAYFGDGYGGIVAVFLFQIEATHPGIDEWLWVVVGDLPPAYLVLDDAHCPSEALERYLEEMFKWVELAKQRRSSKRVIPVNAPATPEFAHMLESRLHVLRNAIVPAFRETEKARG